MRDPHVARLHYKIDSEAGTEYRDPEPMAFKNDLGKFEAREGKLTVEPAKHFAREKDARTEIEPFLTAWEIESDLDINIGTIRFKFASADVIDRNPTPPGSSAVVQSEAGAVRVSAVSAAILVTRRHYADAPSFFEATVDVEGACHRCRARPRQSGSGATPAGGQSARNFGVGAVLRVAIAGRPRCSPRSRISTIRVVSLRGFTRSDKPSVL